MLTYGVTSPFFKCPKLRSPIGVVRRGGRSTSKWIPLVRPGKRDKALSIDRFFMVFPTGSHQT